MKKIFLSSSGFAPETTTEFIKLVGKEPSSIKIGFIPTASDVEERKDYVQRDLDKIISLGMEYVIVDLKGENKETLYQKLSGVDVVLVEGGNTFYLLDWVKKSGFDQIIKKLIEEGKVYYGISAGTYIACPTIEQAKWKHLDDPSKANQTDLDALNLVDFLIVAHYSEKYERAVTNGVKTTNYPVVVLTDKQAIIVKDNTQKIIGVGEKLTFNGFEEI